MMPLTRTSSAEPEKLFFYAYRTCALDQDLLALAGWLEPILGRYRSICTEYGVSVAHLPGDLRSYAQGAEQVDLWVRKVGIGFQQADQLGAMLYPLCPVPVPTPTPVLAPYPVTNMTWPSGITLPEWLRKAIEGDPLDLIDKLKDLGDWLELLLALTLISRVRDRVYIIRVPEWLRELLGARTVKGLIGLKEGTTVIGPKALVEQMRRIKIGKIVLDVALQWWRDFGEYGDQGPTKLPAALIVDTILKGSLSAFATYVGTSFGVGLAGLIAVGLGIATLPAWAAVAAGIGGAIFVGWLGDKLFDWLDEKGYRDKAIDWAEDKITRPVGRAVDEALTPAVNAVSNILMAGLAPVPVAVWSGP